jgi:hypothetical protein
MSQTAPFTPSPAEAPPEEPNLFWTFAIGALVLLALAGWLGWEFYTAAGSMFWPTTDGVVKTFKVWEKTELGGGGQVLHQVELTYDYTVNGQNYTGQNFNSKNNHVDAGDIPALSQQYAGAKIQVIHSPLTPSQSILVREISSTAWAKLVIAVLAALGALACVYYALQKEKPAAATPAAAR